MNSAVATNSANMWQFVTEFVLCRNQARIRFVSGSALLIQREHYRVSANAEGAETVGDVFTRL